MDRTSTANNAGRSVVVLLHGLAAHRIVMRRLTSQLERVGYDAINWGYFGFFDSIPRHAERLAALFRELDQDRQVRVVHFVTHSMGGIIVRSALAEHPLQKAGRFVMLAPPNRGSHVARLLGRVVGWAWPSLRQLSDAPYSFVNQLPEPTQLQVGVITAEPDYVVRPEATQLDCMQAHVVQPGPHGVVPLRAETGKLVTNFLECGVF